MITPLAAVPASFHSIGAPQLDQHAGDILSVTAGPQTDWFVDPGSGEVTGNAPALVAPIPGDFTLSARIEVDFAATYDAGSLVVWAGPTRWGKLAFERSPQGEHMVVSVVTRGESDDCNSVVIDDRSVWLRMARLGDAYAFHYSTDGEYWRLVRHFRLGGSPLPDVGFEAQSPTGDGCAARFAAIAYSPRTLPDLRSGV